MRPIPALKILLLLLAAPCQVFAQSQDSLKPGWWHGIERSIHYRPEGTDFVCVNGKRRFTRAIYGSNTAFRVEAGDLPEFALYMPGMGGNLKFGLASGDRSTWLINAKNITAVVSLSGRSSHAYLLMAGSTNPMQSRVTNGAIYVAYTDGSSDSLLLLNPQTWWPIEQDYIDDGYALRVDAPLPVRVHLKTGLIASVLDNSMAKFSGKMIDGGAATVLDLALNLSKTLKQLKLVTVANDVVIGLMAVTLLR